MATPSDPRRKNEIFDFASTSSYLTAYAERLQEGIAGVDASALEAACDVIEAAALNERRIFAIGNGGSAAIVDHLCCDWTKGTHNHAAPVIDTTSLTANSALYTAIANDFGMEQVFATQIGYFCKAGDVLVAVSSSGNSPNILNAVTAAKERGMTVIGFTGFSGGGLREHADIAIHVDVANYGIIEDVHQMIMHVIAQVIAARRDAREG